MTTVIAFHDVDNVDHWLSSPKREEVFGPLGSRSERSSTQAGRSAPN